MEERNRKGRGDLSLWSSGAAALESLEAGKEGNVSQLRDWGACPEDATPSWLFPCTAPVPHPGLRLLPQRAQRSLPLKFPGTGPALQPWVFRAFLRFPAWLGRPVKRIRGQGRAGPFSGGRVELASLRAHTASTPIHLTPFPYLAFPSDLTPLLQNLPSDCSTVASGPTCSPSFCFPGTVITPCTSQRVPTPPQ